jgi:hypothetical protein
MGARSTGLDSRAIAAVAAHYLGAFVLVCVGMLLLFASPAHALSPPEVFLQELDAGNMPTGGWIPLAGAGLHSVTGYEIGVRLQDTGASGNSQRILVQATSVPDGQPDQRNIYSLCFSHSGTAGQIVDIDERVLYEGDGSYSLSVTDSIGPDASAHCTAGATTSGSFTATAPTSLRFVGHMIISDPSAHHVFGGLQILATVGAGATDVVCARDPRPAADGTLAGSLVIHRQVAGTRESPSRTDAGALFRQPGNWACVGRGTGGGVVAGPWSAPTPTEVVQEGFYGAGWRLADTRGPTYRLIGHLIPPQSAGGILTVVLRQAGRHGHPVRIRTRIGRGGRATVNFRLPRLGPAGVAGFRVYVSFGGTRLAAARGSFLELGLEAFATAGGRVDVKFPPPCSPRSC